MDKLAFFHFFIFSFYITFLLEIDECGINPCITGDCLDFVNGYVCNCTDASFVGLNCSLGKSTILLFYVTSI